MKENMARSAFEGKPYAGNPQVWSDEGIVTPAATPMRGAPLYKFILVAISVATAMFGCARQNGGGPQKGCARQKGGGIQMDAAPEIEKVAVPALEPDTPASCARASGEKLVWDFTEGLPAGGKLRKGARPTPDGIYASNPTNLSLASGFALDKLWTPPGAFLFEAEFMPGALGGQGRPSYEGILWDDLAVTYVPKRTNRGFQLAFVARNGEWTPRLWAGFSNDTSSVAGPKVNIEPGKPTRISFYYGANGRVLWDFAGKIKDTVLAHGAPLAPSVRNKPVIGDRVCSNHHPFDGVIRRVAITPCADSPLGVALEGRTAFVRGEPDAKVVLRAGNSTLSAITGVTVVAEQFVPSGRVRKTERRIDALAAGGDASFEIPVETRVRTGWHAFRVTVAGKDAAGADMREVRVFRVGVGPRPDDRMMALMWGYSATEKTLCDYGFTHGLKYFLPADVKAGASYDEAVVAGVRLMHSMRTVYPGDKPDPRYMRTNRDGSFPEHGKAKDRVPEVSNPDFIETMKPLVEKDAKMYGNHPGFVGVLAISEARDGSRPSFTTEHIRYRKETGRDVPPEVEGRVLDSRAGLEASRKRFPDGVVPVDDPVLAYYRWFWKGGDGWPGYSGSIADGYRRHVSRPDFFVFWDPAVRCPPTWGSGGSVDMLNQWVYAVPEPMNVAGPAEEILAMAAGRRGQMSAIMTQLICYRSQIAPMKKKVSPEPEWVKRRPLAEFPTIPPDTLQEATWSMIAKPVKAIMYHGWGTIYETGSAKGYAYTNPQSTDRIKHLLREVVAPLGPTLKRLGREAPPVAVLESFTTCALGGPASWGWKAPAITFLQRARLDPRVVYEDTIMRDGLAGVKVLYAPQCLFLTPPVIAKIKEFQANGGTLVADEQLLKALKADVQVPVVSFSPPPASDHTEDVDAMEAAREGDAKTRLGTLRAKASMVSHANDLRKRLKSRYEPVSDSSSPEIVVYNRMWKNTRYVVAINDHRTFGDYVGPWGLTMEKGLPFEGEVSLKDDGTVKAVYELSRGGETQFRREDGRIKVPARYDTNDGRMFVFLRQKIASVKVDAPANVRRGQKLRVTMKALDDAGHAVDALLPAEIRLFAADGKELDGAGWVCLEGGACTVELLVNLDDARGAYRLVCRDRASGLKVERTIECR